MTQKAKKKKRKEKKEICPTIDSYWSFPGVSDGKESAAMWETCVQSLGWEDRLEDDMATHSSILAWRIRMDRGAWWATDHEVTELDMTE